MSITPAFTGSVRLHDDGALLMLVGELDVFSAPFLRTLLDEALASRPSEVVIDMAMVTFCDANGLGLLVSTNNQLRAAGGKLSLRACPPFLRKLVTITGLNDALQVEPPTAADDALATELAAAARLPLTRAVLDAALRLVVVMSQSVMTGAEGVSITVPRNGRLRTVAASDETVLQMDHDQYDTGQGPCLDAATQGKPFHSAALESEDRWPQFVPRARARGIESIMSTPLMADGRPLGALNVYSRAPRALEAHQQEWAIGFADQAAHVLLAADATDSAESLYGDVLEALLARETISLAQGVVMTRRHVLPDAALRFLIDVSRNTGKPLVSVCRALLDTTAPSGQRLASDAGSAEVDPA